MNDRVYKCLSASFFRVETFHKVRLAIFSPPCSYKERNCLSFERPRVPRVALCLFIESECRGPLHCWEPEWLWSGSLRWPPHKACQLKLRWMEAPK